MHPAVLQKYLEAGYTQDSDGKLVGVLETATDANERLFWLQVDKNTVKRQINKVIRIRKGNKEYFYYQETVTGKNHLKNTTHLFHTVGYYKSPEFNRVVDAKTGKIQVTDILEEETVYELEWPKDWNSELEQRISETVDTLIITPSRKYGGFAFEDFKEKGFDELVTLGKYGTSNPVIINEMKKKNARNA